jgi:hypothetical protein
VLLGLVVVFVYCGCDWKPQPAFVTWAQSLPAGSLRGPMVWLSEHLCIFSNAGEAIVRQVKHNGKGHGVYILGQTHPVALWYYFPLLLTIKLTLGLLILPVVLLCLRGRALLNAAMLAALLLLLFSLNCRVQIGVRLMLPLVALAVVGTASGVMVAMRDLRGRWQVEILALATFMAMGSSVGSTLNVWPHGLCYVNSAWGSWKDGYQLVSDSNFDWGQGLVELGEWQQQHDVDNLDVWYFGDDPRVNQLPLRLRMLHTLPSMEPTKILETLHGRYLAVGTTLRHGLPVDSEGFHKVNEILEQRQPVARTTTFLIYDFTRD